MGIAIDWGNQIIQITSPTVSVDAQVLHDFIEDQMSSPTGLGYSAIIQPEGKVEDPSNPGVYSQIIIILNSPWQIQFWGGSGYTRIYGGKLVGGLADQPLKATGTAGDITVLESPVDGLTVVSGSGITEQDKLDIADRVLDESMSGHGVSGSLGEVVGLIDTRIDRVLGLQQENQAIDQQVYNGDGLLTSARKRIYSSAGSVGTDNDVLATYTITAAYNGIEVTSVKMVKV